MVIGRPHVIPVLSACTGLLLSSVCLLKSAETLCLKHLWNVWHLSLCLYATCCYVYGSMLRVHPHDLQALLALGRWHDFQPKMIADALQHHMQSHRPGLIPVPSTTTGFDGLTLYLREDRRARSCTQVPCRMDPQQRFHTHSHSRMNAPSMSSPMQPPTWTTIII